MEFPWEGFNERGLSVNALTLSPSVAPAPSLALPTISYVQWIQYILDTSANLSEAMANAQRVRMSAYTTLHYFVCGASAACAAFEYVNGALVIHANAQMPHQALTNNSYADSEAYFHSLESLPEKTILSSDWSVDSLSRYARAALWAENKAPSEDSVSHAFHGLDNLAQVIPASGWYLGLRTYWSLVFNLKAKMLYWRTFDSLQIKSVSLTSFDLNCSSEVKALDVNFNGFGDVAANFHGYDNSDNQAAVETWVSSLPNGMAPSKSEAEAMKQLPSATECMER